MKTGVENRNPKDLLYLKYLRKRKIYKQGVINGEFSSQLTIKTAICNSIIRNIKVFQKQK
ncbi:unnamed protein product [Paramecium octaurelia]|uniref:Uncharacterized protein n=1 Tax=Paramecium octaurelia TaxID=43137 RepID=A0A8S1Y454_PAROT|nr:unnamed protein product [Paramecium octaurelia]